MKALLFRVAVIVICIWSIISYSYVNGEDSMYWESIEIGGKCGFRDLNGKIVIKPEFDECGYFSEELAAIKIRNKWGFIGKTGKIIITPKFDECEPFSDGLAIVRIGQKWGYIDKTGGYVIEPKFDRASNFFDGLAVVMNGEKVQGDVDQNYQNSH